MIQSARFLSAFLLLALCLPSRAATVNFYLAVGDNNGQGVFTHQYNSRDQWTLYATVSQGDNFGLASCAVHIYGVATFINDLPKTIYHDSRSDLGDPDANPDVSAGFTLLRSTVSDYNHGAWITGSQNTISDSAYIIEYFGQASGNLLPPPAGWDSSFGDTHITYYNVLQIAHGTFDNFIPRLYLGVTDLQANVFTQDLHGAVTQTTAAATVNAFNVELLLEGGGTDLPQLDIPNPSSLCLVGLPLLLFLLRRSHLGGNAIRLHE